MLDFYRTQSKFSDPGCYEHLFINSPTALTEIKQIIQGLLFHFLDGTGYLTKIPRARLAEIELRYVEAILQQMMYLNQQPLKQPRKLQDKLLASCRDYSLLACSILRQQGVPARLRVVFNTYSRSHIFHDQVVLEYWNNQYGAWHSVDMRMTAAHLKRFGVNLNIDYFNLSIEQYIPAATAWSILRQRPEQAEHFGDDQGNKGLWYVRDRMLQDLAALNKVEMLIWDCWGLMHSKEQDMSEEELCLLDDIAHMLAEPDHYFTQLNTLYRMHTALTVTGEIVNMSPVFGKRIIHIA